MLSLLVRKVKCLHFRHLGDFHNETRDSRDDVKRLHFRQKGVIMVDFITRSVQFCTGMILACGSVVLLSGAIMPATLTMLLLGIVLAAFGVLLCVASLTD